MLCLSSLLCNLHNGDLGVAHIVRGRRRDGESFFHVAQSAEIVLCLLCLVVFYGSMYFSKGSMNVDALLLCRVEVCPCRPYTIGLAARQVIESGDGIIL